MLQIVFKAVFGKLPFNGVPRPAPSVSQGIAALDHKIRNDPMKRKAVIEAVLCQRYKIRNGIRRNILIKLQFDVAVVPNPDDRRRMRLVLIRIFRAAAADGACRKSGKESRCNFKADFKISIHR